MATLEYRLLDEAGDYPVLYSYPDIDPGEVAARFGCDSFIKAGKVYEKTSTALEPLTYVVYVKETGRAQPAAAAEPAGRGVRLEIRQDWEGENPGLLVEKRDFTDALDLVIFLAGDYFYWLGEEWLKTMTVLDEDRKVYIYYAKKTG